MSSSPAGEGQIHWEADQAGLRAQGSDAATFLQGLLACDIGAVRPECASPGALLDVSGRVISDFALALLGEDDWAMLTPPGMAGIILADLGKVAGLYRNLKLTLLDRPRTSMIGAAALPAFVRAAVELPPWAVAHSGDNALMLRWGASDLVEYVGAPPERLGEVEIRDGEDWAAHVAGCGIPSITEPISAKLTAHAMQLLRRGAVSLEKGCYRGQEIVARTEHRGKTKRVLRVLECRSAAVGDAVADASGAKLGLVQQVLKHGIALALVAVDAPLEVSIAGAPAEWLD
ncbi:MAG: hypothetical protein ISN29_01060 [Gammaproteobacteria bacterium AqS3]|nr:hypothetical protein [Gammaproteobacteria bacterium AqS3]